MEPEHDLVFESEHLLPDQYEGKRTLQKVEIYPSRCRSWNYSLLTAFLNELKNFIKAKRRLLTTVKGDVSIRKFVFYHQENPKYFVYIFISASITVQASTLWLRRIWTRLLIIEFSDLRSWGLHRSHPISQQLQFYRFSIEDPNNGNLSLLYHRSLLYCITYDFSPIVHYFI